MFVYGKAHLRMVAWAAIAVTPAASAALSDYPFRLVAKMHGERKRLIARNDGAAPVTLRISTRSASGRRWPATVVVLPHAVLPLGSVDAFDAATIEFSYYIGRIDAADEGYARYRLPYANGLAFAVTQAYGGKLTSHDNEQNRYAVDFSMPEGTPVVAARAGVVADVTLDHRHHGLERSYLRLANQVTIVHDDGTIAEYAHLAPGTPVVARGQRVAQGALIGYSGNTGYSSAPHLHFSVSKPAIVDGKVTPVSIPILFYTERPAASFPPTVGMVKAAFYGPRAPGARIALQPAARKPGNELP